MDLSEFPLTHDKTLSMVLIPAGLFDGEDFFELLLPFFMDDFCDDMMPPGPYCSEENVTEMLV